MGKASPHAFPTSMQACPRPPLVCKAWVREDLQRQRRRSCGTDPCGCRKFLHLGGVHLRAGFCLWMIWWDLSIPIVCSSAGRAEMLPWGQSHDKPGSKVDSNHYFYRTGSPSAPLEHLYLIFVGLSENWEPWPVFHLRESKESLESGVGSCSWMKTHTQLWMSTSLCLHGSQISRHPCLMEKHLHGSARYALRSKGSPHSSRVAFRSHWGTLEHPRWL